MRASILVLGPLLASLGSARVPLPGGCAIGARPIDLHLFVMESLGANIKYDSGFIIASVGSEGLKGGVIDFPKISVGATESAIMTAVLAKGVTKILNAAHEPEIIDLIDCLKAMGALIELQPNRKILIQGVDELHGATHNVIPDRIEVGTYIIAGAITEGELELKNINFDPY